MSFPSITRQVSVPALLAVCWLLFTPGNSLGQDSHPKNSFVAAVTLPDNVKRVLVLPLTCDDASSSVADGCDLLDPVLQTELTKTKAFEVVSMSADRVRSCTGKTTWTGTEALPADFFQALNKAEACDAVLFCQLTSYKPYVPLAIGWRLKLVDVQTQKVLWEADEVYDASDPAVARNAQQFQKKQQNVSGTSKTFVKRAWDLLNRETPSDLDDQWDILNSPRYFGQFAAVTSLESLPKR
jgi:hypothetical protein